MLASIAQIWNIVASRPMFDFTPTFIVCSPIYPNNFGVVFLWKYILVFEKLFFSFDCSNMQIFTVSIPSCVASCHEYTWPRYFCQHNPLFYHLNLILCNYWNWQRNIFFWWIFLSDILSLCRIVASKQRQF